MEKFILKEVRKMKGTLLGIGIENEKVCEGITANNKIINCYLLEEIPSLVSKNKLRLSLRQKKINIKKIKKVFKKKRIDNIICNYKIVKPYLKTFIRDSIYICKGKTYIYGKKEDYEEIVNRYKRYTNKIEVIKEKNEFIIVVDTEEAQNKKTKDILYWWQDTMNNIIDTITSLLVN